jgi:hypothetical protein
LWQTQEKKHPATVAMHVEKTSDKARTWKNIWRINIQNTHVSTVKRSLVAKHRWRSIIKPVQEILEYPQAYATNVD